MKKIIYIYLLFQFLLIVFIDSMRPREPLIWYPSMIAFAVYWVILFSLLKCAPLKLVNLFVILCPLLIIVLACGIRLVMSEVCSEDFLSTSVGGLPDPARGRRP